MSNLALKLIAENKTKHARGEDARVLDLGNCGLTQVPKEVEELVWLEELILSSFWDEYDLEKKEKNRKKSPNNGPVNKIILLHCSFHQLAMLKKLIIGASSLVKGELSNLSPFSSLSNLRYLNFKDTQVSDLSPLARLNNLQQLVCSGTQVSNLDPLRELSNLQVINCSRTDVNSITPLAKLSNLLILDCAGTQISDLAPLKNLTNLQNIDCTGTRVINLDPLANLVNLKIFRCSSTEVEDLTPLANSAYLQDINFLSTQVRDITPLSELTNLQKIVFHDTKVNDLSPLINLTRLQLLYFSGTQVTDLAPLSNLTNLELIDCSRTQISDLSPLSNLTNLQQFEFDETQVRDLTSLTGLNDLELIHCNDTPVHDLTPLAELNSLIQLDCANTKVTDLKPILSFLMNRREIVWKETFHTRNAEFNFYNCPLINPPPEIVKQGNNAILQYFASREKQGTQTLSEAKIVVVGAGESGKTTLIQKLLNPEHPVPNPNDRRTEGINVTAYPIRQGQPNALTAYLWDFGGQELYHTTHQFFLTPDTLYLLLNDNRKNDTDFYYWLNILALRAGDSCPILTIFNAKDKAPRQIVPDEPLFAHFPGLLREAVDVDFADKDLRKIHGLKDTIEQHFAALPALGKPFPAFWVRVREALAQRQEEHISWAQFRGICRDEQLEEEIEMRVLAQTLHNLGVLLWFPEVFGLEDLIILKPQWCIDAVYEALDTPAVRDNFGRFSETDLHKIWLEERYRSQCTRLLKLMQHFDLCYTVEGSPGTYIAPQLLPVEPQRDPNFEAAGGIVHRFQYEFMPAGLLTRFIARMGRYIYAPYVWRVGVTLRWPDGTTAEVVENQYSKEIVFRIIGAERKRRLSEMRQTLASIHDMFRGLKYEEKVSCNCSDCANNPNATTFPLSELEDNAQHGDEVICRIGTRKRIAAKSILNGIEYRDTPRIFISYSHHNRDYKNEFTTMIAPLVKKGDWKVWDDEYLLPGDLWNEQILKHFSEANVLVLLLTADFFASDDKWDIEMNRAIDRHNQENALIIGIVVSDCLWEHTPFRMVQMLPKDGVPVERQANRKEVWKAVAIKIVETIGVWQKNIEQKTTWKAPGSN